MGPRLARWLLSVPLVKMAAFPQVFPNAIDTLPGETPWTAEAADALLAADFMQADYKWQQALDMYRKALSLSPTPPAFQRYVINNNIGWSLFQLNHWAEAEEYYQMALRAVPAAPPTDHAYINMATLFKAQGKPKAAIEAFRSAVQLTKMLPIWAQFGRALMMEFRVDEAMSTLQEGLAYRGDADPGAQECHWLLGTLNMWRRRWSTASTHFIKSIDLGLPHDTSGCRGGRWAVTEGWSNTGMVTAHPLATDLIVEALHVVLEQTHVHPKLIARLASDAEKEESYRDAHAVGDRVRARALQQHAALATAPFTDAHALETYSDAPDASRPDRSHAGNDRSHAGNDRSHAGKPLREGCCGLKRDAAAAKSAANEPSAYKLVELRNVLVEGQKLTSLFHGAPECVYYVGEHSASGLHSADFGVSDREQNSSYDKTTPFHVKTQLISSPTFAVFDVRGASQGDAYNAQGSLLTKLIVLLHVVIGPRLELASPLDYDEAKMFLPQFLAQQLALLKEPLRAAGAFFSYSDEGSMELPAVLQDQV